MNEINDYTRTCQKLMLLELLKNPETRRFARDVMAAYPEVT